MCMINDDYEPSESLLDGDFSCETTEVWKVSIDDECLLLDSKHYETCGMTYYLDAYNAYDDKGNKIEGEYITLTKKEYDNIK